MKLKLALCAFLLSCLLVIGSVPTAALPSETDIALSAKSAVLIDAASGEILYQKNAHQRMGMASTTKLMTALVVARTLSLSRTVRIPREAVGIEGSSVYLCEGELLSIEQLLYALLLASANDAAVALALATAGSVERFASLMNDEAARLGLRDTSFTNPHGLYDENHYTTAAELAIIARAVKQNTALARIVATRKASIPKGVTGSASSEPAAVRHLQNHNKLLSLYEGADGMKTGFTKKTGRCLVSSAERDGLSLICVTLGAPDDWSDHTKMLDFGFSHYCRKTVYDVGEFTFHYALTGGKEGYVTLTNTSPITLTLPREKGSYSLRVLSSGRFAFAPARSGEVLATLVLTTEAECASSPLAAAYEVQRK